MSYPQENLHPCIGTDTRQLGRAGVERFSPVNQNQLEEEVQERVAQSRLPGLDKEGFLTLKRFKSEVEQRYLSQLLSHTRGRVAEAARISGVHRPNLYRLLRRYGIDPKSYKL